MAKIINTVKKYESEFHPAGSVCGARGDFVQFDKQDLDVLCDMSPVQLKNYMLRCIWPRIQSTKMLEDMHSGKVPS